MLISCPNCKTSFAVPAKAIGAAGRKVKCTKCSHVWFQAPVVVDKDRLDNLLDPEFKASNTLPVVRYKKQKLKYSLVASLVVLLLIAGFVEVLKKPTKHEFFSEKLDLPNYDGLRFHNLKVESEIVDNKVDFYITGTIVNMTENKKRIPVIDAKVFSQGGRVMAESQLAIPKEFIEPYEKVNINPEITGVSGNADKIELSFENWLESSLK